MYGSCGIMGTLTRGAPDLPGPIAVLDPNRGARGEVVAMKFSEFLKYLIVLLLAMAMFVAVSR